MFDKYPENSITMSAKTCCFFFLAAIELVLACSLMGFLNIRPVAITTMGIPVLIGAFFLGKWGGAAMGGVFGVISMWKASNVAFTAADAVFSPFTSPDPWGSLFVGLGARVLFGFCSGVIFDVVKRSPCFWPVLTVATIICSHLHSVFVMTGLGIFFPELNLTMWSSFSRFFTINSLSVNILSALVMLLVCYVDRHTMLGKIVSQSMQRIGKEAFTGANFMRMILFMGAMFIISSSLALHFIDRVRVLLQRYGYDMTLQMQGVIEGWGIQFVVSVTAVSFILYWIFTYFYEVSASAINKSQMDPLTNLYNKQAVEHQVDRLLRRVENPIGALLMLDIDHFKDVNDSFGHAAGDAILCQVAIVLQGHLEQTDIAGRLGGDEFCIYMDGYVAPDDLERRVHDVFTGIKQIQLPDGNSLSCSMGITRGVAMDGFHQFYSEADKALYFAKNKGRNQYSFFEK